jgi:hypothetical protein
MLSSRNARCTRLLALLLITLTALCTSGCASDKESLSVAMDYRPKSRVQTSRFANALPVNSKIFIPPVIDRRLDMLTLGANRAGSKPIPVFAATPPAEFFHRTVSSELTASGVKLTDARGATHVLMFELVRFSADESPSYRAEIVARAKLTDAKGNVRWEGPANGFSAHSGEALTAANYQEVLSDCIVMLVEGMLTDSSFQAGLK